MKVCVGTKNPTKLSGVEEAFKEVFKEDVTIVPVDYYSINPQPIGLNLIVNGAKSRALQAMRVSNCDFYVGVEAGIFNVGNVYIDIQAAFILRKDGEESLGFSPGFPLPKSYVEMILSGKAKELEEVVEKLYGIKNIGEREGVIHILSKGLINRKHLVKLAVITALLPWLSPNEYFSNNINSSNQQLIQ